MFKVFRGIGRKKDEETSKKVVSTRGLEVIEDDPDTAWGLWDNALADMDSKFGLLPSEEAVVATSRPPRKETLPVELEDLDTRPMELTEKTPEQRMNDALQTIEIHHPRIANSCRNLWGDREFSAYITKLIMSGGDGMGRARVGFNQNAVDAMMELSELHDMQFGTGTNESGRGIGFTNAVDYSGLDHSR